MTFLSLNTLNIHTEKKSINLRLKDNEWLIESRLKPKVPGDSVNDWLIIHNDSIHFEYSIPTSAHFSAAVTGARL